MSILIGARHRLEQFDLTALATQIIGVIQNPVVVWDAADYPVVFNTACLQLFGYSATEFAELNRSELTHPAERDDAGRSTEIGGIDGPGGQIGRAHV